MEPTESTATEEKFSRRTKTCLRKNLLIVALIVAMVLGVGLGAGLRYVSPPFNRRQISYLRFPGDMLMNMLSFLIVPLIISSLVSGLGSLDSRTSGRIGIRAVLYYLTSMLAAVILGILLTISIRPGERGRIADKQDETSSTEKKVNTADTFLDLIR